MTSNLLSVTVIASTLLVAYAYLGYPLLLAVCARLFGREESAPTGEPPSVSVLIAALNEESVIESRIENLLGQHYPADRLVVVIASDGSIDDTCGIVRRYERAFPGRVRLLDFPVRRGKSATLNDAMRQIDSTVVVFSDANTEFAPDAVAKLARWFADPKIGMACGKLTLTDHATGANVDGLYWRYENAMKEWESRLGVTLGANGGIYAIRRDDFAPIPNDTIIDDFVIPLAAMLKHGKRSVYDKEACAFEEVPPHVADEFRRRTRIGTGAYQSLFRLGRLAWPGYGWLSLAFVSHKVLRWTCPWFLAIAWIGSAMLITNTVFFWLFVGQTGLYLISLLSLYVPLPGNLGRLARLCGMFTSMNLALAVGFVRWLRRRSNGTWERTAR